MILHLFLGFISLAVLFFFIGQEKRRRIWSILLFGAVLTLLCIFYVPMNSSGFNNIIYSWIPHHTLQSNLSFVNAKQSTYFLQLIGLCMLGLIYLNILYRREAFSLSVNNLILLNFAALIILLSAQDFIQLMIGSCCFAILGFYFINDIVAKEKFIFYNFLAELAVFTALAIVYAKIDSVSLSALSRFSKIGQHKDLVSILLLGAVFIKSGMFLFQHQMIDVYHLSFNRVIIISLFSIPLSGFVLFMKLLPLITASSYASPIFFSIVIISAIWGSFGALLIDNIKAKTLYLTMLFNSFILYHIWSDKTVFLKDIICLYPPLLLIFISLLLVGVSLAGEKRLSHFGGLIKRLWLNLALSLGAIFIFSGIFVQHFADNLSLSFLILFSVLLAVIMHGIYLGRSNIDAEKLAQIKPVGLFYAIPFLGAIAYLGYKLVNFNQGWLWGSSGVFMVVLLIFPTQIFTQFAQYQVLQEADVIHKIYQICFITPLRLIGRILWLAIDFMVIERSIIGSISHLTRFIGKILHKIQTASWGHYWLMLGLGLAFVLFNLGLYYHE